jgi:nucleotide-binding universal stress UspA family protein
MPATRDYSFPLIASVLHPTDFSDASLVAFHHALKVALIAKSAFTLLHVAADYSGDPLEFPCVRETLDRWGILPKSSPPSALAQLDLSVNTVVANSRDPVKAVLRYVEEHIVDLIVLATHQHEGRAVWMSRSVASPIARRADQMTLLIPQGSAGFVSAADGSVSLKNVLIPVAESPGPQPAIEAGARFAARLGFPGGTFTLLHVGEAAAMPVVQTPEVAGWEWKRMTRTGDVIHGIADAAREIEAGLVVMSTDGRNGFLDALRGSHSERVLRQVPAPLLTVPAGSLADPRSEAARH